jgi:NADH dehydrogenase FAD-containing subunit
MDERFQNIYSCGDVTDTDVPTPNARSAMQQSVVAAENILLAVQGKAPQHEYQHTWPESFITLTLGLVSIQTRWCATCSANAATGSLGPALE